MQPSETWHLTLLPILAAFFLPYVLPVSVVTTGALWLLDTNFGIINYLTGSMISWFQDPNWAMPAVAVVTIWWTVGFNMLLFISGLHNISPDVYEAAAIDGANRWQQFLYITCPLIWPVASLVLLLQLIAQFKIFDQVYLLTQGGPYNSTVVVLLYMYRQAFQQNRGGYAAAVAVALLIIMLIGSAIAFRARRPIGVSAAKRSLAAGLSAQYGLLPTTPGWIELTRIGLSSSTSVRVSPTTPPLTVVTVVEP